LSLPEEFLFSSEGQTKRIFRAAMRDIVPREILERKDKVGFATPEREWLLFSRKKVVGWLESLDSVSFLRKEKCHDVVSGILNGSNPFSWQPWIQI
jgi:asparagine synthase (glutamine-hydrolysing)